MGYLALAPDAVRSLAAALDGGSRRLDEAEGRVAAAIGLAELFSLADWPLADRSDRWSRAASHLIETAGRGDALAAAGLVDDRSGILVERPGSWGLFSLERLLRRGFDDRSEDPGGTGDRVERRHFELSTGTESSPLDTGRAAVAWLLEATADAELAGRDEFLIVDHGDGRVTVVLPGVTDLSRPDLGYADGHRSVRDLDQAAVASWRDPGVDHNRYAQLVRDTLLELPSGTEVAIVGHSFGADTAADLAADAELRDHVVISHVVAAGYAASAVLEQVPDDVRLLLLDSRSDLVALAESRPGEDLAFLLAPTTPILWGVVPRMVDRIGDGLSGRAEGHAVETFTGGLADAGHHPSSYADAVRSTGEPDAEDFLTDFAASGHAGGGRVWSVDVSVPE